MYTLAKLVRTATTVAVALIVAGIVIHLVGANTSNGVVKVVNDAAKWLVQPFHDVFHLHGAKANVAVNWGIAAVVYAIVGGLISRLLAHAALGGTARRPLRRTRAV